MGLVVEGLSPGVGRVRPGVGRPVVVGHGQGHLIVPARGVGMLRIRFGGRRTVPEVPLPAHDDAVVVLAPVGERARQLLAVVVEVCLGRLVGRRGRRRLGMGVMDGARWPRRSSPPSGTRATGSRSRRSSPGSGRARRTFSGATRRPPRPSCPADMRPRRASGSGTPTMRARSRRSRTAASAPSTAATSAGASWRGSRRWTVSSRSTTSSGMRRPG